VQPKKKCTEDVLPKIYEVEYEYPLNIKMDLPSDVQEIEVTFKNKKNGLEEKEIKTVSDNIESDLFRESEDDNMVILHITEEK